MKRSMSVLHLSEVTRNEAGRTVAFDLAAQVEAHPAAGDVAVASSSARVPCAPMVMGAKPNAALTPD